MIRQTRRSFLRQVSALAATPLAGCAGFPAITRTRSPNSLLSHACIGTGNQARRDLDDLRSHAKIHITALCDVDANYLAEAKALCPEARIYRDAFEMFAEEGDRIDSVNVSTPDHAHTPQMLEALKRNLHIYGQKPLCHQLADCRRIERLAAERGVVTQMGTQIAAWECDRQTELALERGLIGPVRHVWLFSTRRPQPPVSKYVLPTKADPVPATLDWKLWLCGATPRDYADKHYHPCAWRKWKDFGSSWLGDLALHLMSPVWMGLGLGKTGPTSVVAEVSDDGWTEAQQRAFWPQMSHVTWRFPGVKASDGKPFAVEWCDGFGNVAAFLEPKFLPPAFLQDIAAQSPYGCLPAQGRVVEGEKGWLLSTHFGVAPVVVMKNGAPSPWVPFAGPATSHYHEFVDCCLNGRTPRSSFDWTARLCEWGHLGNIAQLTPGKVLNWNAEKGVIV